MTIEMMTRFFMWCTLIDAGVLILWTIFCVFATDLVYRMQSRFFPISRETFNIVIYCFLGAFKLAFLMFNVVPYIALLIIG